MSQLLFHGEAEDLLIHNTWTLFAGKTSRRNAGLLYNIQNSETETQTAVGGTHRPIKGSVFAASGPDIVSLKMALLPEPLCWCVHGEHRLLVHSYPVVKDHTSTDHRQKDER